MKFLPARHSSSVQSRVSVEAIVVLLLAAASQEATASAASSWSSRENWDESSSASTSSYLRKRVKSALADEQRYAKDVTPFSPGSNNVSLDLGQVFLMGNLGNTHSDNIGAGVHYTYGVSELFAFESALGYSSHDNLSMFSLQAGLRTNLAWYDKVIPYASFGLGFYRPSYSFTPTGTTVNTTPGATGTASTDLSGLSPILFGVHIGPGVDLELTRNIYFGASITFNDVFGKTELLTNNKTFDVGGTYTTFYLHAGTTF